MTVICPIAKSPHPSGRIGNQRYQDWYRSLEKAADISAKVSCPRFLLITAFHEGGSESEMAMYRNALTALAPNVPIDEVTEGFETIHQVDVLRARAASVTEPLVVVSTFLHYPRVRYLSRGLNAEHFAAFGIPRPREVITDIALIVAMPLIDALGLRDWLKQRIQPRRKSGSF